MSKVKHNFQLKAFILFFVISMEKAMIGNVKSDISIFSVL
jgi:hypothetical protein